MNLILENHLHMIVSSDDISKIMAKFKSYAAKELINLLQKSNAKTILEQLAFYKKAHKTQTTYQLWQKGIQPKLIVDEKMMIDRINYIHNNSIKRGYVVKAKHWRYSSAKDYEGISGLIEIEKWW